MPTDPMHAIRNILGMTPDYAALSLTHLEVAENMSSQPLIEKHLSMALTYSNHALIAALTETRRGNDWAGMDGNE